MTTTDLLSAEAHFAFGKNWIDYAQKIDESKIAQAVADLQRLSGRKRFDGMSFLDIGCGSGLHSLAAVRMGAVRVVGVDIDADSITAARFTLGRFAPEADAHFAIESVFEMTTKTHGGYDLIYSWGVLHHTGDMRRALTVAASLVRPGGTFMVALYRKTTFCGVWRVIKRWYASATPISQQRAMKVYILLLSLAFKILRRDFRDYVSNYSKNRGMDFHNDVHDWMGGYPYESIRPVECHALFAELGFQLEREFTQTPRRYLSGLFGSGCDEYAYTVSRL
jgi:2-polyprenyl-3-methyl-5-hydroxy-6-metoxy-1,4-benzoquinol methylase